MLDFVSIMALQLTLLSYFAFPSSTIIEEKHEKPPPPIHFTEFGIVIDVRPLQFEKVEPPILVTELGIVIEVRPEQDLNVLSVDNQQPPR